MGFLLTKKNGSRQGADSGFRFAFCDSFCLLQLFLVVFQLLLLILAATSVQPSASDEPAGAFMSSDPLSPTSGSCPVVMPDVAGHHHALGVLQQHGMIDGSRIAVLVTVTLLGALAGSQKGAIMVRIGVF